MKLSNKLISPFSSYFLAHTFEYLHHFVYTPLGSENRRWHDVSPLQLCLKWKCMLLNQDKTDRQTDRHIHFLELHILGVSNS